LAIIPARSRSRWPAGGAGLGLGGGSGARRVLRAITERQGPPNLDPSHEGNAELRRRTKAREIAYYDNETEYYLEERECFEDQYDDEQCAYYHQSYIARGNA
jgi:hypothetical protein